MDRSSFIKKGAMAIAAMPLIKLGKNEWENNFSAIKFGLCADVHHDFYPHAPEKLNLFIQEMTTKKPDFIAQLGDFCTPRPENSIITDIWNKFDGVGLHVVGNHDPEMIFSQREVAQFWGIPNSYYSLDINGYHIVVLDGNDVNPNHTKRMKYEKYIGSEQLSWLKKDLEATDLFTIIMCHQGIDVNGLDNTMEIRTLFDEINKKSGFQKIQMVFSGHHHNDYYNNINGIHYFQINSMCYAWTDKYGDNPYDAETTQKYPLLKRMNHYKDPLWAFVEIETDGTVTLTGKKTAFFGASPYDKGMVRNYNYEIRPEIRDKKVKLTKEFKNAEAFSFL